MAVPRLVTFPVGFNMFFCSYKETEVMIDFVSVVCQQCVELLFRMQVEALLLKQSIGQD